MCEMVSKSQILLIHLFFLCRTKSIIFFVQFKLEIFLDYDFIV